MIQLQFDLLHTDKEIIDLMMKEFLRKFNTELPTITQRISTKVRSATFNYFKTTAHYQSLIGGELAGHFGIPINNRQGIIDSIIKTVADHMVIEYKPLRYSGGKFRHGINIRAVRKDMSDVLSIPAATIITEKGEPLPWLEWLLLEGDKIIIRDYEIDFVYGKGRSGLAVMDESQGGVWRVPSYASGTLTKNWLTEAIQSPEYKKIIQDIIERELNGY